MRPPRGTTAAGTPCTGTGPWSWSRGAQDASSGLGHQRGCPPLPLPTGCRPTPAPGRPAPCQVGSRWKTTTPAMKWGSAFRPASPACLPAFHGAFLRKKPEPVPSRSRVKSTSEAWEQSLQASLLLDWDETGTHGRRRDGDGDGGGISSLPAGGEGDRETDRQ